MLAAHEAGDSVAAGIVTAEAGALSQAALLAVTRLGLGSAPAVALSGGVLGGSERFRSLVAAGITRGGLRPRVAVLSSTQEALAFADRAGSRPLP